MWEEKVNRLARHGDDYRLSESLEKVALKNILVGKSRTTLSCGSRTECRSRKSFGE